MIYRSVVCALPLVLTVVACGPKRPPPDFAPEPGLLTRIEGLRATASQWACPGHSIPVQYDAILDDGTAMPFETRYDDDAPPALHVVFLRRYSREATPLENGGWYLSDEPLLSVLDGFRLVTEMRHKPSVADTTVIGPEYTCLPNAFTFEGGPGERGQPGLPGPDVIVRLDILESPFYQELLVAEIKVGAAPPFYLFHDAALMPSSDYLQIVSRGGPGGRGIDGAPGRAGVDGTDGCPAGAGGAGGAGGDGLLGAQGGAGGPITVIVPQDRPYLARLVDARGPGGRPGPGGQGGPGGKGGAGGAGKTRSGETCQDGPAGPHGEPGEDGPPGRPGPPGPRTQVLEVPSDQVFGPRAPLPIRQLLDEYGRGN